MNDFLYLQPKSRSKFRLLVGTRYYKIKRYTRWYLTFNKYAKDRMNEIFDYPIAEHKTPLYRRLKDIDMWLQHNKVENLKLAVEKLDGIIIRPGETFSYWKLIGKPTFAKGYKSGLELHYGKFVLGVGGGLCQLSNMLYWLTLHTPLTITERYRHSFDVFPDSNRTQPFGSGATCVYNYRDFSFKNETNECYQINLRVENYFLCGEILSDVPKYYTYEVYEANHSITHEYWGAYIRHNELRRKIYDMDKEQVDDIFVCENHGLMMYEPLIEAKE